MSSESAIVNARETNCAAEAAYVANALGPRLLGFEIEGPGVVRISHRDVWLKTLP